MLAAAPDEELLSRLLGRDVDSSVALGGLLELDPADLARLGFSNRETEILQVASEIARRHQPGPEACSLQRPEDVAAQLLHIRRAAAPLMVALVGDRHGHYGPPALVAEAPDDCAVCDPTHLTQLVRSQSGATLIVVHNHLAASVIATQRDLQFTFALARACREQSIELTDHVIVGKRDWISLRQARALD